MVCVAILFGGINWNTEKESENSNTRIYKDGNLAELVEK
jgi:hypothetical protein